jgi:hypothetical protein
VVKLTFVIGLCGSGKTYHSEQLAKETGAELFEGLVEKQQTDLPRLLQCLKDGKDCVVEEISFCRPDNREFITRLLSQKVPDAQIEWICIENDLEAANWNVTHRTNKGEADRHMEINGRVHQQYSYPDDCTLLPITRIRPRT